MQSLFNWLDSGYNTINSLISYYRDHEKKMMLWGAGNRGIAFLQMYDPNAVYLSGVYDMYPSKQGTILKTGHHVFAPEEVKCDVIFVLSNGIERFARKYIKEHGRNEKVIDILDIIFGKLPLSKIIQTDDVQLIPVRKEKICGLTIMYYPKEANFSYVKQYAKELDHLVIFDNSPSDNKSFFEKANFPENTEYYWNHGNNIGLGDPINLLAEKLANSDYNWILTFDQDSVLEEDMITGMRKFINSDKCTEDVAVVSPQLVSCEKDVHSIKESVFPFCTHTYFIAQSGMLQRIRTIQAIGGYDKNLFIDSVDTDFVVRCMMHGYQTIRLNDCFLYHQLGDKDEKQININGHIYNTNKYGPLRYYYQYRNALYCKNKFRGSAYEFIWDEVLNVLNNTVSLEERSKDISEMIVQAKQDYSKRVMGKYCGVK
ncbi:MAG: hypothetical protein LIV24_00195 [Eubacterium sp.]|uniref:Glycosyltransferase n=1 Tax=Candidatus Weimeria bifida TaxID=2599074 RepID=A0A6N7IZE1_9FIRM|nr:hypothetical protein [Eubacterium sp.]MQN01717.1 glycosyltransferase [Candidatus Weimeria bifida]RRF94740.1 MAG: glycosyltransferase [Lachnospiraceae bacterium]